MTKKNILVTLDIGYIVGLTILRLSMKNFRIKANVSELANFLTNFKSLTHTKCS